MTRPPAAPEGTSEDPATRQALERLLTFVDAVVAIAITLLVLPIVDETTHADPRRESLHEFLGDNRALLYSFLISFTVIFGLWRSHHRLFERLQAADALMRTLTEVWTFTIVLVPFTTQIIVVFGDGRLPETLYIGGLLLSSVCVAMMGIHASRTPSLVRPDHREEPAAAMVSLTYSGLFVVALVIALVVPGADYTSLLVLLLAHPVMLAWRWWAPPRHRALASEPATSGGDPRGTDGP